MEYPDKAQSNINEQTVIFALKFTPAEWHSLLSDPDFLDDGQNNRCAPRRLMGVPVEIVPDHRFG